MIHKKDSVGEIAQQIRKHVDYTIQDPAIMYNLSEQLSGIICAFRDGENHPEQIHNFLSNIWKLYCLFVNDEVNHKLQTVLGSKKFNEVIKHEHGGRIVEKILNRIGGILSNKTNIDISDILKEEGIDTNF